MTTKTAVEKGEDRSAKQQEPGALSEISGNAKGMWASMTRFLDDVRAEMRKVVAPSRKEVEVTTGVVVVTVFLFGLFFFVVDHIFGFGINAVLQRLGGMQ